MMRRLFAIVCLRLLVLQSLLFVVVGDEKCEPSDDVYRYNIKAQMFEPYVKLCNKDEKQEIGKVLDITIRKVFRNEPFIYSSKNSLNHFPLLVALSLFSSLMVVSQEEDRAVRQSKYKELRTTLKSDLDEFRQNLQDDQNRQSVGSWFDSFSKGGTLRRFLESSSGMQEDNKSRQGDQSTNPMASFWNYFSKNRKGGSDNNIRQLALRDITESTLGFQYNGRGRCRGCDFDNEDDRRRTLRYSLTERKENIIGWIFLKSIMEPTLSRKCSKALKSAFYRKKSHCLYRKRPVVDVKLSRRYS